MMTTAKLMTMRLRSGTEQRGWDNGDVGGPPIGGWAGGDHHRVEQPVAQLVSEPGLLARLAHDPDGNERPKESWKIPPARPDDQPRA